MPWLEPEDSVDDCHHEAVGLLVTPLAEGNGRQRFIGVAPEEGIEEFVSCNQNALNVASHGLYRQNNGSRRSNHPSAEVLPRRGKDQPSAIQIELVETAHR